MRDELMSFQQTAVIKLLAEINSAVAYHKVDGRPQVVAFRAPTGSGKTIVMTTVIEDILNGTDTTVEQPEAIFVWLSDSPQLNEQSKTKIIQKADKIRPNQCVTIEDESFDQELLDKYEPDDVIVITVERDQRYMEKLDSYIIQDSGE